MTAPETGSELIIGHLSPHLGGGVGKVVEGFLRGSLTLNPKTVRHRFFCLDKCLRTPKFIADRATVADEMACNPKELRRALSNVDVILCHYWNHPLLSRYLITNCLPPSKILFWIHNSGLQEPNIIPTRLLESNKRIVFSSKASAYAPNVTALADDQRALHCTITSTRCLDEFFETGSNRASSDAKTRVLYLGTVSKAKMHPDTAEIFAELSRKGLEIDVVGGDDGAVLEREVSRLGGEINACGWNDATLNFYRDAQIFVYPLQRDHYGTGEQVILEAMAAGLPVVGFDNQAERAIIDHGRTGFLAKSKHEFIDCVDLLRSDQDLYKKISENAIQCAKQNFSYLSMTEALMREIMSTSETPHPDWSDALLSYDGDTGLASFAFSSFLNFQAIPNQNIEQLAAALLEEINLPGKASPQSGVWLSATKGSPFHYLTYFPDSAGLKLLCHDLTHEAPRTNWSSAKAF